MHFLEGALLMWSIQIKASIGTTPGNHKGLSPPSAPAATAAAAPSGGVPAPPHPSHITSPGELFRFWEEKASNLALLWCQLESPRVKKILYSLDKARSGYIPAFRGLIKDLAAIKTQCARRVLEHSIIKEAYIELHATDELQVVRGLLRPLFHGLMLLWVHGASGMSEEIENIVLPVRSICNELIRHGMRALGTNIDLFGADYSHEDAISSINSVIALGLETQIHYMEAKQKAAKANRVKSWKVPMQAMFERLDAFIERCGEVKEVLKIASQVSSLGGLEIGGRHGDSIAKSVHDALSAFELALSRLQSVNYGIFDIDSHQFHDDSKAFWAITTDVMRRIATLIRQSLGDCHTDESRFKLLESFGSVMSVSTVRDELEQHLIALLIDFEAELVRVGRIFYLGKDSPPLYLNMPPVAGALSWTHGLGERVRIPLYKYRGLGPIVTESEEMATVERGYRELVGGFKSFNLAKREAWEKEVGISVISKLDEPLLGRDSSRSGGHDVSQGELLFQPIYKHKGHHKRTLFVNFDGDLVLLLREVKYLMLLGLPVPEVAMGIYTQADKFRTWTGSLDLMTAKYNWVLASVLEVEAPLIADLLDKVDALVEVGIKKLTWNSPGIGEFIATTMGLVGEMAACLGMMKDNVAKIELVLGRWISTPMYHREDLLKLSLLEDLREDHSSMMEERASSMGDDSGIVIDILATTSKGITEMGRKQTAWQRYVSYVSGIVVASLSLAIQAIIAHMSIYGNNH